MKKIWVIGLAAAIVVATATHAAFNNKIRFYNIVAKGIAGGSISQVLADIGTEMGKQTGYDVKYMEVAYTPGMNITDMVYTAFRTGQGEMAYVQSGEYMVDYAKYKSVMTPAFTLTMNNRVNHEECIFVRADDGYTSLAALKGKTWGGVDTRSTRLIMHENSINMPVGQFFGKVKFIEDAPFNPLVDALAKKEIDVFTANRNYIDIAGGGKNVAVQGATGKVTNVKLKPLACTEGELNWVFVFNKAAVPPDVITKITNVFLGANKNPGFKRFQFMFISFKCKFVPIRETMLERTKKIVEMRRTLGWEKEYVEHLKKRKTGK